MNDTTKHILIWAVIAAVLFLLFNSVMPTPVKATDLTFSAFTQEVNEGKITAVTVQDDTIKGEYVDSKKSFETYVPKLSPELLKWMLDKKVDIKGIPPKKPGFFETLLISWGPLILIVLIWIFLMKQMSGGKSGGGGAFSFGKSRARMLGEDQVKVTLDDVAGIAEAKEEVAEVVDFLKDTKKYQDLGGKIPRGILMVGPPGTGKTLLARAIAGEAKVPFFSISGSDFVEMFVGVGASRVRDMFSQAKKRAPCIIFIDEIDAVGRHRGAGYGGGHDEREQTLNQLLVEMDGFAENEGVIVIAATNRPDVLDPALLRPGRFDRQVVVGLPDIQGREQILKVHMKKLKLADDVDAFALARGTPGFSGAELANLANEAALIAARKSKTKVTMLDFEMAKDKILMGTERRTLAMTDDEKRLTAYHEAGHAIVGRLVPDHDPVYKISIIPRGMALGVTMYLPERDQVSYSKRKLESQLSSIYGGRVAEELIFGLERVTTGASNDIQKATELARSMVTKWGLSDVLGPVKYGEDSHQPFLGHSMGTSHVREFSETTAATIDAEIRQLIERNYARTVQILKDNIDILHAMSEALIQYETLDVDQVNDLMARRPVKPSVWEETHLAASAPAVTEEAAPADTAESGSSDASGSPQISGEVGVSKVSDSSEASNVSQASQGDAQATSDTPKAPAASKDKDTPS